MSATTIECPAAPPPRRPASSPPRLLLINLLVFPGCPLIERAMPPRAPHAIVGLHTISPNHSLKLTGVMREIQTRRLPE